MKIEEIVFYSRLHELLNMADDVVENEISLSKFQREWFVNELVFLQSEIRDRLNAE